MYALTCKSTPVLVKDGSSSLFSLDSRRASAAPCFGLSHGYWVSQLKLCSLQSYGNPPVIYICFFLFVPSGASDMEATEDDSKEFPLNATFERTDLRFGWKHCTDFKSKI